MDAFYQSNETESVFPADEPEAPTVVRRATLEKSAKEKRKSASAEKSRKEAELEARYDVWNKGYVVIISLQLFPPYNNSVKTLQETYEHLKQQEYESSKPLARYADDADLTDHLKSQIHVDDPMAQYFLKKQSKKKKHKSKKGTQSVCILFHAASNALGA